jgi:hypothetical protein
MPPTSSDQTTICISELRGLFEAFAWFNEKVNHGYTYSIAVLPRAITVHDALVLYLAEQASEVTLSALPRWREEIGFALQRWLFAFDDLVRPGVCCNLTDSGNRQRLVQEVLEKLSAATQARAVWRVQIKPTGFYECAWDDFAFEGDHQLYFLHLGVSD